MPGENLAEPGCEALASVSGAGVPRLSEPLFWSRQRGQFCITPSHVVTAISYISRFLNMMKLLSLFVGVGVLKSFCVLKGVWHEIIDFRFLSQMIFTPALSNLLDYFRLLRKFAEIFATLCLLPMSLRPAISCPVSLTPVIKPCSEFSTIPWHWYHHTGDDTFVTKSACTGDWPLL